MSPIILPNPSVSEIEPGLYLGDLVSSYRNHILAGNTITAKLSLQRADSAHWHSPTNRAIVAAERHLLVRCADSPTQDLLVRMTEMCDFIEEMRGETNRHVLVHCTFGISRSPTVVVAYLMRKYRLSLDSALDLVKEKRRVKPNANFMEQLVVWGETGYDIWADEAKTIPKSPYAAYLERRAGRLKELGLTGNEPLVPDL